MGLFLLVFMMGFEFWGGGDDDGVGVGVEIFFWPLIGWMFVLLSR
jgi:hypothetical protein